MTQLINCTTDAEGESVATLPAALPIDTYGDQLTVSSRDFAEGLGIQHKNLLASIRQHQMTIEADFGPIVFEVEMGEKDSAFQTRNLSDAVKQSTKPLTVAHLTEDQALFVGTLSRNSQRVVAFKSVLVRSFIEARKKLAMAVVDQSAALSADYERRLSELEQRLSQPTSPSLLAMHQLQLIPRSTEVVPEESTRMKITRLVNTYARATGADYRDIWNLIYDRLYTAYRIKLRAYKKLNDRESRLDVAERKGYLDKVYAVASADLVVPNLPAVNE